jgi:hypothetical protein
MWLRARKEYTLLLRVRRTGEVALIAFSIAWPVGSQFPETLLAQVTVIVQGYLAVPETAISRIDLFLHSVHCIGQFIRTTREVITIGKDFNLTIESRPSPTHVIVQFGPGFAQDGHFSLKLINGRILVSSPAIVSSSKTIRQAFIQEISLKKFDPVHLITSMREVACEARLSIALELLKRAIRLVPAFHFWIARERKCLHAMCDDVIIFYSDWQLLRIQIDLWTGHYVMAFRSVGFRSMIGGDPGWLMHGLDLVVRPPVDQLLYLMFVALWNLLTSTASAGMYGSSPPGMTMAIDLYHLRFLRTYSFAPDFSMKFELLYGHPKMSIVDKHGSSFSKPEVAEMDCVPTESAWRFTQSVLWATKRYIFLAQAHRYLTDFKIRSDVVGESLHIELPFCSVCELRCTTIGWQLICVPAGSGLPVEPEPITKVTGRYTSRCALVVAHLVLWYAMWRSTNFHIYNLVQESIMLVGKGGDSQSLVLTIGGSFLSLSLSDAFTMDPCSHFVRRGCVCAHFNPSFDIRAPAVALIRHFIPVFTKSVQVMAFIRLIAIPLFRISGQLRDLGSNWAVVPLVAHRPPVSFSLVYKGRYSVSFIIDLAMSCTLLVPKVGRAAFLMPGFQEFRQINSARSECHIVQLRIEQIDRASSIIETLGNLFDAAVATGFIPDPNNLTFRLKLHRYSVQLSITGLNLTYTLQGCEAATESLNRLSRDALDLPAFVSAVTHLLQVFLPADQRLLTETLKFFAHITDSANSPLIYHAMHTATIENDGKASIHFNTGPMAFTVAFPVPLVASSQIEFRLVSHMEKVRGVDGLLTRLRRDPDAFFVN